MGHLDLFRGLSSSRIGDNPVFFQKLRMEMGVAIALLLLVVVVGFLKFSGKKKLGLTVELVGVEPVGVELAGVAPRAAQETWLGNFDEERVNRLLLETAEPDGELCAHLDDIELDENLQFLRFSEGYCEKPSRRVIKYRCLLANESESFYRCRLVPSRGDPPEPRSCRTSLQDQWLYTVIQPQQQKPDMVRIHSNVVPRQAYLKRLTGLIVTCCEHEVCTRGFSRISVLREGEPYTPCTNCALGDQLGGPGAAQVDAELAKLWDLAEAEVQLVEDRSAVGAGVEGRVEKVYWRRGVFAKKTFFSSGPSFDRELEIATEVSHPNIVHCFGVSKRPVEASVSERSRDEKSVEVSLCMELLDESLEARIQEPRLEECPFSFQDILSVLWQVADAMRELHKKRFIHKDLKPDNILMRKLKMPHSESGVFYLAKVADFGRAQRVPPGGFADPKSADPEAVTFRSDGGGRDYTAPEVFNHRRYKILPEHPEKIDVYSFGVIAYQMLAGVSVLYDGIEFTDLRAGVMDGTLRPSTKSDIKKLDSDRKYLYESLVVKCWDANPESRPSFSKICDDLEHWENGAHGWMGFFSALMKFLKRQ